MPPRIGHEDSARSPSGGDMARRGLQVALGQALRQTGPRLRSSPSSMKQATPQRTVLLVENEETPKGAVMPTQTEHPSSSKKVELPLDQESATVVAQNHEEVTNSVASTSSAIGMRHQKEKLLMNQKRQQQQLLLRQEQNNKTATPQGSPKRLSQSKKVMSPVATPSPTPQTQSPTKKTPTEQRKRLFSGALRAAQSGSSSRARTGGGNVPSPTNLISVKQELFSDSVGTLRGWSPPRSSGSGGAGKEKGPSPTNLIKVKEELFSDSVGALRAWSPTRSSGPATSMPRPESAGTRLAAFLKAGLEKSPAETLQRTRTPAPKNVTSSVVRPGVTTATEERYDGDVIISADQWKELQKLRWKLKEYESAHSTLVAVKKEAYDGNEKSDCDEEPREGQDKNDTETPDSNESRSSSAHSRSEPPKKKKLLSKKEKNKSGKPRSHKMKNRKKDVRRKASPVRSKKKRSPLRGQQRATRPVSTKATRPGAARNALAGFLSPPSDAEDSTSPRKKIKTSKR